MLAYALASKPCSEATDIGYILFGVSVFSWTGITIFIDNWKKGHE